MINTEGASATFPRGSYRGGSSTLSTNELLDELLTGIDKRRPNLRVSLEELDAELYTLEQIRIIIQAAFDAAYERLEITCDGANT